MNSSTIVKTVALFGNRDKIKSLEYLDKIKSA